MVQLYLAQDILEFKEYLVEHSNLVESLERVEFVEILIVVVEAITLRRASTLTARLSCRGHNLLQSWRKHLLTLHFSRDPKIK